MVKFKRFFMKTIAVVSTVAMFANMMDWSKVSAAAQEEEFQITENVTFSREEMADNDELFAGYVQKAFSGDSGISLFSTENHTMNLNTDEKSIYEALKTAVTGIAAGSERSTEISIAGWTKTFTYTELGLDASADGATIQAAVQEAFADNINISKIIQCLMADCPYELYWYDKTKGTAYTYRFSYNGSRCTLSSLYFKMTVASAYASDTYTTDTTITGATSTAVANARAIVTANEGRSDYRKLVAYRNEICEMVSYNEDAVNNADTPYGDPWQLIYVFDDDSNTNVVCEGYSKAFQYLCELSTFTDDVICYTVSGYIPGGHMWNHVTIGDKNYLVDVTNCDAGTIGAPDKLFLKGMTGDISSGYAKTISSQTITYTFKDKTKEMFGTGEDSILNLSADDYKEDPVQRVSATASASSLTWKYAVGATLTATPVLAEEETGTPTYQWYRLSDDNTETVISGATSATYAMDTGLSAGTYTYRVYAAIGNCKKSADVSVTVEPLVLTKNNLEFTSNTITKEYDGTTSSTATVQIKAGVVADGAVAIAGTAVYNSPNVPDANTVTFTPEAITTGDYTLAVTETIEHSAKITKKKGTATPAAPTATTANIKDTEITLTVVKDCEYSKDGTNWQDSPKFTGLTPNTSYTFYQRIKDSDNVEVSASSSANIKTLQTSLHDATLTLTLPQGGYTYDGTEKKPSVVVSLNGVTVDSSQYTVDYTSNKNAGTQARVIVTANTSGQYLGSVETTFTIEKAPVTIDVGTDAYNKVYKDEDFTLSDISYTGDGSLTYTITDSKYISTDGSGNPTKESVDDDKVITVSADGKVTIVGSGSAKIKITATEGTNYKAVGDADEKVISVTVGKAVNPPYKPDATLSASHDCTTVSDVTLSGDWMWTDETASICFDSVADGSPVAAIAVYQGADANHYETISVDVAITRAASNIPVEPLGHDLSAVPKKGDVVADDKGTVKVEVADVTRKEVIYKATANKKAKTVTIPATVKIDGVTYKVTKIADNAFKNNKTVTKVTVGSNIKTIGKNAFYKCTKLKTVKIGKNVTEIGENAFNGCKKLKTITIKTTKLTGKNVGSKAFKGIYAKATIKVPESKLTSYKKLLKAKGVSSKTLFTCFFLH